MYKTPSGAVKLQVLLRPGESRVLQRWADKKGASVSWAARRLLREALGLIKEDAKWETDDTLYQPRGFAK